MKCRDRERFNKAIKYLLLTSIPLVIIISLIYSSIVRELVGVLTVSFIISYTLKPLQRYLVSKGLSKKYSSVILLLALVLLLVALVAFIIPTLFKESITVKNSIVELQNKIISLYEKIRLLANNKTFYTFMDIIYAKGEGYIMGFFNRMLEMVINLGGSLLTLAIIPIVVYYFLSEGDNLGNRLLIIFPVDSRVIIKKILRDIDKMLGKYIVSQFFLCFLIALLTFFILLFFKVDYPLVLSIFNGVLNIIPYFGPIFGAIPAVLLALIISPQKALYVAIALYIIQQIEGDIIAPKITGDSVDMHPLTIILLLIIGGKIGGFFGMVLAVPIGVALKILYEDLNYYLF